jgi:hypothetical protein
MPLLLAGAGITGWVIGYIVGIAIVLVVVALVLPILLLANRISKQALDIDRGLGEAVDHTAALAGLTTTIDAARRITAGLARGRTRLGG